MRHRPFLISIALVAAALLIASAASAQPIDDPDEAARVHFDQGKALAAAKKFREAYIEFEAGYRASPRPAFLFNMGEAARQMGDVTRARDAYTRYLAAEPEGTLAATAQARLAALAPAPAPAAPPAPAPAPAATTPAPPPPAPPRKPPPRPVLQPRTAVTAVVEPSAPTGVVALRHDAPASRPMWKKWPFWALVGSAVVAGTVFGVVASRNGSTSCGDGCIDLRP